MAMVAEAEKILTGYGLRPLGNVEMVQSRLVITLTDQELAGLTKCIYAFAIGDEIVRIGSSKGVLKHRMGAWQRDVSRRLAGMNSSTPQWEADAWNSLLQDQGFGLVFARPGTEVSTPVGTFSAYMDEESILIGRYRPRLNRSFHR